MKTIATIIILVVTFSAVTLESFASPVDTEDAKKIAQNFMGQRRQTSNAVQDVVVERGNEQSSFYVVNFSEGGWVMVSSDDATEPVFGYSFDGRYRVEDEKPDAFLELVNNYKDQVSATRSAKLRQSAAIKEKWSVLMVEEKSGTTLRSVVPKSRIVKPQPYSPGRWLLNVPDRGEVAWGQGRNNSSSCSPAYNAQVPKTIFQGWLDDCDCDKRPPAGCGAVAMGQVMWYWLWPKSSEYRTYNWAIMPNILTDGQTAEGSEIAHLLRDCGLAANMTYACLGSFTTSIEPALRNRFAYRAARTVVKSDWTSSAWIDLIRTEIRCERPVIYYGERANAIGKAHYFVVDGYDAGDNSLFHINFGWRGGSNGTFRLGNITPESHNFNSSQSAIIGISPTYPYPSDYELTDVPYSNVYGVSLGEARADIVLPASGKEMVVRNGGSLTLTAGNSITLNPGFQVELGGQLTTEIEPHFLTGGMEARVAEFPSYAEKGKSLMLSVSNTNSFDVIVRNSSNQTAYQGAGVISSSSVSLWSVPTNLAMGKYTCSIRLRNNFGRILEKTWTLDIF